MMRRAFVVPALVMSALLSMSLSMADARAADFAQQSGMTPEHCAMMGVADDGAPGETTDSDHPAPGMMNCALMCACIIGAESGLPPIAAMPDRNRHSGPIVPLRGIARQLDLPPPRA
ncbi:MAG: hypothetical protein R3E02_14770 [Blastomonas sp.]